MLAEDWRKASLEFVKIDATHFVLAEGRDQAGEYAVKIEHPSRNFEVVEACESEGGIVGVRTYYHLGVDKINVVDMIELEPQQRLQIYLNDSGSETATGDNREELSYSQA
ncbi:hypothetical protein BDZ91DRAFT_760101 [Kalaharituber pfeilii]|nr:hypothetical protein BDZ91DRAFT_760101 [Kalaharituber pfeilii]